MHGEWYNIPDDVSDIIGTAKAEGRRIIASGTTTMRCLEGSAAANGGQIRRDLMRRRFSLPLVINSM